MKRFLANIKKLLLPRPIFVPVILIIAGLALFLAVWPVQAGFGAMLAERLILPIAGFFGNLTVSLIGILISVAKYNNFIHADVVVKGWVMIRDVINMFFIIMLMLIAFGTVFRWENYHYKKMLGKLLIAAVLINFSLGIVGFMIDFAQVIMLTFVYAFQDAAAGNFVQGFHLEKMFQFSQNTLSPEEARTLEADDGTFLVASLLALISIFITMVVIAVFLIVLIMRIVILWFLAITSPIAFSLNIFPGELRKYADQWWNYFGKYLTIGPILAFFLWLSLYVMQITGGSMKKEFTIDTDKSGPGLADVPAATITGIGQSDILLSFIVNIGLLIGALIMTQQAGVVGGKLAGAAVARMQKIGAAAIKAPFKGAWKTAAHMSKEYGKRIGYGAGITLATAAAKLPIVGNQAARLEGKLRHSRAKSTDKYTEDLSYVSEETGMKMAERFNKKMTGFRRILTGEGARARGLYAVELAASRSQDKLPANALPLHEEAALYNNQANKLEEQIMAGAENITVQDQVGNQYNYNQIKEMASAANKQQEEKQAQYDEFVNGDSAQQHEDKRRKLDGDISSLNKIVLDPKATPDQITKAKAQSEQKIKERDDLNSGYSDKETKLKKAVDDAVARANDLGSAFNEATEQFKQAGLEASQQQAQALRAQAGELTAAATKIKQEFWQSIMNIVAKQAGHKITVENNDVYTDRSLGEFRERFLNSNPSLIPSDQQRVVTDPQTPKLVGKVIFDENEQQYRQRRIGANALAELSLSDLSNQSAVMGHLADNMERLTSALKTQRLSIDQQGNVREADGTQITNHHQLFQIFKSAFQGLDSFRATQSPRKVALVDNAQDELFRLMERKAKGFDIGGDQVILDRFMKHDRNLVYVILNKIFPIAGQRSRFS